MRPVITLLCKNLYASPENKDVEVACGVELFHNFTLLHDDIMDQAPLRRGQASVHSKWNPNIGILAGDALMIKAFQFLAQATSDFQDIHDHFNRVALEVCEGQQQDMDFEKTFDLSSKDYLEMIRLKTASLIGFSAWLGGKLGGASSNDLQKLYELGNEVGMGFQLMDDYLDAFGDPHTFGKKVGGDVYAGKKTILWISAMEAGNTEQKSKIESIYGLAGRSETQVREIIALYRELQVEKKVRKLIHEKFRLAGEKIKSMGGEEEGKLELNAYLNSLKQRNF
jgi:geranylgeranyl diphosphate synthase, type II